MKLPHEKFCVLPWISLETSPIGTIRPCCLADDEITRDDGTKYNLNTDSLISAHNSNYMEKLRKDFLDGKCPATCRKCWDEEKVGRTSKRMNTLKRLRPLIEEVKSWHEGANELMFLDLKLGNICNLKCRICGSWSSSTFAGEEIKFAQDPTFHKSMNKMGAWPRNNEVFWKELAFLADEIRYLEFTGGEPFMIREHFQFLQTLVDKQLAKKIEIHYNTNGTQWPEEYVELWKNFKHVEIAFSIDNIGDRFEYERTNAKWDEVNDNIKKFIELRAGSNNISLQLCSTINIHNVLYLHDIVNWEHFKDFDFVFWNMLHDAPVNCIKSMPNWGKWIVEAKLMRVNMDPELEQEFENVIKFMNSGNGVPLEELREHVKRMDERRGVTLETTHPELYKIIYGEEPDWYG